MRQPTPLLSAFAFSPGRAPFDALGTGWRLAPAILALEAALIAGCSQPESRPNMKEHGAAGQPTMDTEQVMIVNEHPAPRPVDLGRATAAWAPAEARLLATRSCDNATLTIDVEGAQGTVWLDRVYLIGEEAVLGLWRPDVVEALKRLESGVIRWGSSAIQGYDWLQGIGPWDRRVPFTTCWGGLEANFVGQEE